MDRQGGFHTTSGVLLGRVAEILPDALFFASFSSTPTSDESVSYVCIDDKVHYDKFYYDFGPVNLSVLHRFSQQIHDLVQNRSNRVIVAYTDESDKNRVNGAFLMAGYLMTYHGMRADSAYLRVDAAQSPYFIGFRDASYLPSTYDLTLYEVLKGLEQGLTKKWYDVRTFDVDEYELYESVENGDLNWIVPEKIFSFAGPHEKSLVDADGYIYHAPEVYFDYFREHKVTTIVRLNSKIYDAKRFTDAGFDHVELYFPDGSTPSEDIVREFIRVVDTAKGGVAIHCKAGLGRTGTLIACWMMKEFGISAAECIAWLRICRPGSVIGPQQHFLLENQKMCWDLGRFRSMRRVAYGGFPNILRKANAPRPMDRADGIRTEPSIPRQDSFQSIGRPNFNGTAAVHSRSGQTFNAEEQVDAQGRSQGDRLRACKVRNAHTTNYAPPKTPITSMPMNTSRASSGYWSPSSSSGMTSHAEAIRTVHQTPPPPLVATSLRPSGYTGGMASRAQAVRPMHKPPPPPLVSLSFSRDYTVNHLYSYYSPPSYHNPSHSYCHSYSYRPTNQYNRNPTSSAYRFAPSMYQPVVYN